ncbi:MAG: chemotaxis protein CheB [Pseudomonadota bacterium]
MEHQYEAVVIGGSAGGLGALDMILPCLAPGSILAVLIVQHISPGSDDFLARHFGRICSLRVSEPEDKEPILPGNIYIAPPNYHLMVETDRTIALSVDGRVNYSRPSIDVLFETAAQVYQEHLAGLILTGANADGARGLARVKDWGGLALVQNPETAEARTMPESAIRAAAVDHILDLKAIGPFLNQLGTKGLS